MSAERKIHVQYIGILKRGTCEVHLVAVVTAERLSSLSSVLAFVTASTEATKASKRPPLMWKTTTRSRRPWLYPWRCYCWRLPLPPWLTRSRPRLPQRLRTLGKSKMRWVWRAAEVEDAIKIVRTETKK
jgi:hypothetical protein